MNEEDLLWTERLLPPTAHVNQTDYRSPDAQRNVHERAKLVGASRVLSCSAPMSLTSISRGASTPQVSLSVFQI